jgi:hypothetical protein
MSVCGLAQLLVPHCLLAIVLCYMEARSIVSYLLFTEKMWGELSLYNHLKSHINSIIIALLMRHYLFENISTEV